VVSVGRSLVPNLYHGQGHLPLGQVARSPINLALTISREGACTASLADLLQCLTTLTVKNFFLTANLNLIQFKAITPCPITTCPSKFL